MSRNVFELWKQYQKTNTADNLKIFTDAMNLSTKNYFNLIENMDINDLDESDDLGDYKDVISLEKIETSIGNMKVTREQKDEADLGKEHQNILNMLREENASRLISESKDTEIYDDQHYLDMVPNTETITIDLHEPSLFEDIIKGFLAEHEQGAKGITIGKSLNTIYVFYPKQEQ